MHKPTKCMLTLEAVHKDRVDLQTMLSLDIACVCKGTHYAKDRVHPQ